MFCNSILLLVLSAIIFILVIEIVGDTGPGRDDRAELTQPNLTQADLTPGQLDPHPHLHNIHIVQMFKFSSKRPIVRASSILIKICNLHLGAIP